VSVPVGKLGELIGIAEGRGLGIYVQPLLKGDTIGGVGSGHRAEFTGWVVGWLSSGGGDELAVGPSLEAAVDAAIEVWAADG
jgi:hypothetical protein